MATSKASRSLEALEVRLARERVYEAIRHEIITGTLLPGMRLKEVELSARWGVSRTPVREALHRLMDDGLVELEPHRGAVIRIAGERDLREVFGLRTVLESFAASEAALHRKQVDLDALDRVLQEQELVAKRRTGEQRVVELVDLNQRFHRALVAATDNHRLITAVRQVTEMPLVFKSRFWDSEQQRQAGIVLHHEIVDAVRCQDPQRAEATMKAHILAAFNYFLEEFRARQAEDGEVVNLPIAD